MGWHMCPIPRPWQLPSLFVGRWDLGCARLCVEGLLGKARERLAWEPLLVGGGQGRASPANPLPHRLCCSVGTSSQDCRGCPAFCI